jgi:hypothetical protein
MDFGGIRDLTPLADLPCLRGLHLYQVRKLDTGDLAVLGDCTSLEALSLGALRNVNDLSMLARGPSETLRFLILERLTQLDTLAPVASCKRLEQLGLYESKPTDARLDVLLGAPRLSHLIVGDAYPREQFDALRARGGWKALWHRGNPVQDGKPAVRWRAPVASLLESPSLR